MIVAFLEEEEARSILISSLIKNAILTHQKPTLSF